MDTTCPHPRADLYCHKFLTYSWTCPELSDPPSSFHLQRWKSEISLGWTIQNQADLFEHTWANVVSRDLTALTCFTTGVPLQKISDEVSPGFGTLHCASLIFSVSYFSLIFCSVLIIPVFVGGIAIFIIIFYFISMMKLAFISTQSILPFPTLLPIPLDEWLHPEDCYS